MEPVAAAPFMPALGLAAPLPVRCAVQLGEPLGDAVAHAVGGGDSDTHTVNEGDKESDGIAETVVDWLGETEAEALPPPQLAVALPPLLVAVEGALALGAALKEPLGLPLLLKYGGSEGATVSEGSTVVLAQPLAECTADALREAVTVLV